MSQGKPKRGISIFLGLALVAIGLLVIYVFADNESSVSAYRFAPVERGPILSTVSSTGTLNAVITVQVGSQVSGQIKELLADFNSEVRKGQVIARIDPENFKARVRQAEAELAVASANVAMQRAALERARADLQNSRAAYEAARAQTEKARVAVEDAKRDLGRKRALYRDKIISESEIDKTVATYDQAVAQLNAAKAEVQAQASLVRSRQAQLSMAKAQVEHALAQVKQREAVLHQSKVDLEHTVIRSPVDGVVIERSVDIGQTVAASLQAPTLFTIAQDLRKMQVDTNVDEADIGRIRMGQSATFTVDAFPARKFVGRVDQIRKAPETIQNVVTYTVVVSAENPELHLLPGMTANVQIIVDKRDDTLKVSNGALRFRPPAGIKGEAKGPDTGQKKGLEGQITQRMAERLERLTEALQLNKDQQTQIRVMFGEARKQMVKMRNQGATPDELRAEIQRQRDRTRGAIIQILTPQQRLLFRRLLEGRAVTPLARGRVWIRGQKGEPRALEIITGISDGSFTEVVQGDLQEGEQVIISASQPQKKSSGRIRRRFGF